jgi:hypothetical protein
MPPSRGFDPASSMKGPASPTEGAAASLIPAEGAGRDFDAATAEHVWGIGLVPWLWGVQLRILFVIDGRITEGRGGEEFGLGLVLDTMRDRSFAWWVRIDVDVVSRN